MIGKLKGIVDTLEEGFAIIDVGGVGYKVFASSNTLRHLPPVGGAATLHIETHVREDHIHLFGFLEEAELEWFKILVNTVTGIGPKMALAILSGLNASQISTAIAAQDKAAFTQVSGVGTRLAERILTELKGKVDKISTDVIKIAEHSGKAKSKGEKDVVGDAISALINLGYNRSQAYMVVNRIVTNRPEIRLEDLVREGLRELAVA